VNFALFKAMQPPLLLRLLLPCSGVLLAACPPDDHPTPWEWEDRRLHDAALASDAGLTNDADLTNNADLTNDGTVAGDSGFVIAEGSDASPYPSGWAGSPHPAQPASCSYGDLDSWTPVRAIFDKPFRYMLAALVNGQLRALVEAANGGGELRVLDLDVMAGTPRVRAELVLRGSQGLEPYGFAASAEHLVAFTRVVASNAIAMKVYDQQGNLVDERPFGIGSFMGAAAALDSDGSFTLAASFYSTEQSSDDLVAGKPFTRVVERRRAGKVEFSITDKSLDRPVVAARGDGVELLQGSKLYEVSATGLEERSVSGFQFVGMATPYSAGWFGLSRVKFAFVFAPEGAAAVAYPISHGSVGGSQFFPAESPLGIAWAFEGNGHVNLVAAHPDGYAQLSVPGPPSAYGLVAIAGPTDVGVFYTSDSKSTDRPLSYWGLHCPY
jgi:hypothetical protein